MPLHCKFNRDTGDTGNVGTPDSPLGHHAGWFCFMLSARFEIQASVKLWRREIAGHQRTWRRTLLLQIDKNRRYRRRRYACPFS
jgi:hypothetical protein